MEGLGGSLFWLLVLFLFMYFMLVRPQRKMKRERDAMLDGLEKGNEIVTVGGFFGKIIKLDEETMLVKIADNLQVKMQREAVNFVIEEEEEE